MKCSNCGAENRRRAAFCTSCGEPLKRVFSSRDRRKGSGGNGIKVLALAFGALMVGLVVVMVMGQKQRSGNLESAASRPAHRSFSTAVQKVASRFFCGCGSCDVPELADCTCPTAIEEKTLIERELNAGTPERDVIRRIDDRYGRLKPQYASLAGGMGHPDAQDREGDTSEQAGITPALPEGALPSAAAVATAADARRIAARFTCACGQCQDRALSECNCDQPRGAAEMKAFIAYRISQKRHTVEEIVKAVAYEYGHLMERP